MAKYAIIGGTGFEEWLGLTINRQETVNTPYGSVQFPIIYGMLVDIPVIFLSRHGPGHITPPHRVNYRANIWALKEAGVTHVVAINAVGGITVDAHPGAILIPDQVIDYTWGRPHTFYEVESNGLVHADFTYPYDACLRAQLLAVGRRVNIPLIAKGTYGACQGPRFETAAEINRLEKDGCILASSQESYTGSGLKENRESLQNAVRLSIDRIIKKVVRPERSAPRQLKAECRQ